MSRWIGCLAVGSFCLLAVPAWPDALEPSGPARSVLVVGKHAPRVRRAMKKLDRVLQSRAGLECSQYFEDRGWRISGGVSNGGVLVINTDVELPGGRNVYGAAQQEDPWTVIYLNPAKLEDRAWPRLGDCEIGSILLHELGHLARKDVADNEPADFFHQCKLRCFDPGGWR